MKLSQFSTNDIRCELKNRLDTLTRAEARAPGASKWRTSTIREIKAALLTVR